MKQEYRFIVFESQSPLYEEDPFIALCVVTYNEQGKLFKFNYPMHTFDNLEQVNTFVLDIMRAAQLPMLHVSDFPVSAFDDEDIEF